jgi:hypothetical protein
MKISLLIFVLAFAFPAFAQSPILELRDDGIPGRKLLVFAGNRYQFFPAPGTRPFEGDATFGNDGECQVRFVDNRPGHSISVIANRCNNTGKVTLRDFVNAVTYALTDKTKNK